MANYKYLKDNNLFEAHMRFMRAIGESYGYAPIEEADDDPNAAQQDPNAMGGQDPMAGGMPGPDTGGMPGPDTGDMPQDPTMGGGMPDPNADQQDPMAGGMPGPETGDMPGPDTGGIPDDMGAEEPVEEEDDVIDVDDITNAQEKTNDKVNSVGKDLGKVDTKIEKLLGAIETLQGMFDKNNQEIEDLKAEFEKRNPTQTEKLNLRSLDSYPFKVRPTDYWAEKGKNSNYSAYADNQEPTTQEYVITNDDVDDFSEREVADSFSIDDIFNQDIKRIFGL